MVFIEMFVVVSESTIPSFWLNEYNFVMYSYVLKVQQGHSCSHRIAVELMSDLIFCCCCSTMEKKKLSQAHAMLDTKESKFDKSSSLVVLAVTIPFFLW